MAIGVGLVTIYQFLGFREPSPRTQTIAKRIVLIAVAMIFVAFLWRMTFWQNSIRVKMEMPPAE